MRFRQSYRWSIAGLALVTALAAVEWSRGHSTPKPASPSGPKVLDADSAAPDFPEIDEARREAWFDGSRLAGWRQLGGGQVALEGGLLVLTHDAQRRPGYLIYEAATPRDGMVRLRCRVPDGDSGLFFHSRIHPRHATEIEGPQVQLNTQPGRGLGGVFVHHGPGWLRRPWREPSGPPARWLNVSLKLHVGRVAVVVDGLPTVDYVAKDTDNLLNDAASFALQIHGGGTLRAEFARIEFLPWKSTTPTHP